eukprot:341283-Chlamydomonas_euryale.AAC.1
MGVDHHASCATKPMIRPPSMPCADARFMQVGLRPFGVTRTLGPTLSHATESTAMHGRVPRSASHVTGEKDGTAHISPGNVIPTEGVQVRVVLAAMLHHLFTHAPMDGHCLRWLGCLASACAHGPSFPTCSTGASNVGLDR